MGISDRLLRLYFISDARYRATVGKDGEWSGRVVWAGKINPQRAGLLADLKLPAGTGPANWWLTEFEDHWPYARAAGDVYFVRDSDQASVERYAASGRGGTDLTLIAYFALAIVRPFRRRRSG